MKQSPKNNHGYRRGIIETIVLIVIALLIASFFGFNLREALESELVVNNFAYLKDLIKNFWNSYIFPSIITATSFIKSLIYGI